MSDATRSRDALLMSALGDRRKRVRMEVVGVLRATLVLDQVAPVVNISTGGMLIESPDPLPLLSTQPIRVMLEGETIAVQSRVRHIKEAKIDDTTYYQIGLEFVSPSTSLVHAIEQHGSRGPAA